MSLQTEMYEQLPQEQPPEIEKIQLFEKIELGAGFHFPSILVFAIYITLLIPMSDNDSYFDTSYYLMKLNIYCWKMGKNF